MLRELTPNMSLHLSNLCVSNGFVKMSVAMSLLEQCSSMISLCLMISYTKWYLIYTCLAHFVLPEFVAMKTATRLSLNVGMGLLTYTHDSLIRLDTHQTSLIPYVNAIYSTSVVDNATLFCFLLPIELLRCR